MTSFLSQFIPSIFGGNGAPMAAPMPMKAETQHTIINVAGPTVNVSNNNNHGFPAFNPYIPPRPQHTAGPVLPANWAQIMHPTVVDYLTQFLNQPTFQPNYHQQPRYRRKILTSFSYLGARTDLDFLKTFREHV